jgi:hypothetical protein
MKIEGPDTTTGYPTLRKAIQRTSPTRVWISQLTEPNGIYGIEERKPGKSQAQGIYPLRDRLQELKNNLLPENGLMPSKTN